MPKKIIHTSGAVEFVDTDEEKEAKVKHQGKKKSKDFSQEEINDLTIQLAKMANLI